MLSSDMLKSLPVSCFTRLNDRDERRWQKNDTKPYNFLEQFSIVEGMIEKQLTDPKQVVHLEDLGAQLTIETLYLLNMASLQAQEGSQDGSCACTTDIVKHLVGSEFADFFQVLQNYNRYQSSVCVCVCVLVGGQRGRGENGGGEGGGGEGKKSENEK